MAFSPSDERLRVPVPQKALWGMTGSSGCQAWSTQVNHWFAVLVVDADVAIEELRQLHGPAGAALDGVVALDPADGEDVLGVVDHVEDRLDHAADLLERCV